MGVAASMSEGVKLLAVGDHVRVLWFPDTPGYPADNTDAGRTGVVVYRID